MKFLSVLTIVLLLNLGAESNLPREFSVRMINDIATKTGSFMLYGVESNCFTVSCDNMKLDGRAPCIDQQSEASGFRCYQIKCELYNAQADRYELAAILHVQLTKEYHIAIADSVIRIMGSNIGDKYITIVNHQAHDFRTHISKIKPKEKQDRVVSKFMLAYTAKLYLLMQQLIDL